MITEKSGSFFLHTDSTTYILRITEKGHPEHIYYGGRLAGEGIATLEHKRTAVIGSAVAYDASDPLYSLDTLPLEYSGVGKGDYRHTPAELLMPDGAYTCDFVYFSHRIYPGAAPMETLPGAYGGAEDCATLELELLDKPNNVTLTLFYTTFDSSDVITRRCVLKNSGDAPLHIRRLMSMMADIPDDGWQLLTLDGGWNRETHIHTRPVVPGLYVNDSTTGSSSNRHNPAVMLCRNGVTENTGEAIGLNLVYSGNHYTAVEANGAGMLRLMNGINPCCFDWELKPGERFETPEAVLTYSDRGKNGVSQHFHDFINNHIVRGDWKGKERPVLANDWEACFFKFTRGSLVRLARRAAALGAELFVLDDGWFGKRDDDTSGLGDYSVNTRKLPGGLSALCRRINALGMDFGLWVEPEMVSEDSDLYRAHPKYAVRLPDRAPSYGRNQLLLDLCRAEARDYIVESVRKTLASADIKYVKWDFNRHLSDMYSTNAPAGEFFHRYMIGLYEVLGRVFGDRPDILFESCASGGGRFDLGMLCFSQQIWSSDDTDPVERLAIQEGLSHFYPLSAMGAHISAAPHSQTLRRTPLSTRFNVAAFGAFGLELDPGVLTRSEKKELRGYIDFYKRWRSVFQFGRLWRCERTLPNKYDWLAVQQNGGRAVAGHFQTLCPSGEIGDRLPLCGLEPGTRYTVRTLPRRLSIGDFGGLINHISPIRLDPRGFVLRFADRNFGLTDCVESYEADGATLMKGVRLNNQFIGTGYNDKIRMLGDFGSNIYIIEKI